MKKEGKRLSYLVLGVFVCLAVLSSGVFAALSVDVDDSGGISNITLNNPSSYNLYSYEINFESTGSYSVTQNNLLGVGAQATYGSSKSGTDLSVYGSHLGSEGLDASGAAFGVSYSGELNPLTALIVLANTSEVNLCLSGDCCGDGIIQTNTEECDGGTGCDSSCQLESTPVNLSVGDNGGTSGGSSGGGGGGLTTVNIANVKLVPNIDQMTVGLVVGQSPTKEFKITNEGNETVTFSLRVAGLPESIKIEPSSLTLDSGESGVVKLTFGDIKQGLFAGNIIIAVGENVAARIPVTVNVKTSNFIYDLRVSVPFKFKYILPGEKAIAEIDFKKIGNVNAPAKVQVYYVVKDFTGRTILEEEENLEIAGDKLYSKEIETSDLPLGKYIIGVEAVYPGAYASASTQFEVVIKEPMNPAIVYAIILAGLVVAGILAIGLNKKKREIQSRKYSRY